MIKHEVFLSHAYENLLPSDIKAIHKKKLLKWRFDNSIYYKSMFYNDKWEIRKSLYSYMPHSFYVARWQKLAYEFIKSYE